MNDGSAQDDQHGGEHRQGSLLPGVEESPEPFGADEGYDDGRYDGDDDHDDDHHDDGYDPSYLGGARRRKKRGRGLAGCLAVLVALAVVGGGAYVVGTKGYHYLQNHFSHAADYPGPGHGHVLFQVHPGDSTTTIGRNLKAQGVVASVDAFLKAANGSQSIQVGYYQLKKRMSAGDAFKVLDNPKSIVTASVTIPEGLRAVDIVKVLAARTKYSVADFQRALRQTSALGLPSYAHGRPEGYLFPSTYGFGPKETPLDMLRAMVTRWKQAAVRDGLVAGAQKVQKTPGEVMTIASLIQAEGRGSDMAKVSRVIYNRLDGPGDKQGTAGLLQIDATVNYALGRQGVVAVTDADTHVDSPYNTYLHPGLPPGPINSPGDAAIKAALNPAPGDWYYYVTVNLRTGETKFGKTYQDFLRFKQEFTQYCTTSSRC